ncbi:MAG TPA: FAD-dependent monooxygenase [Pseudonocardiaceae bacterium]|jgi:anthraniloyl-CoA monooxygenase|nr:FAD-dependent monooxygenase [Pseudonocardiaceae bacterium]
MRVEILGAGPAGLYLAILLRKADAAGLHTVTVTERNPPDATFGWGVVFSEETLGALRDADYPTYLEITDTFARWDAIDIRYRGELLRSRGHGFAAIARKRLLAILQDRCRILGVQLYFDNEVTDLEHFGVDADLVVAADGVRSVLREHHGFRPAIVPQGGKYAWFGTDLVLDSFTFLFRETEHGLFQVHSYPFDEHTSTFIVECQEPVWRAAGLDSMSEDESIAFCERLFADDLRGHRLMSNRSVWQNFLRVENGSWRRGNVVLVGDAAHTAHFSIGSGTKLAMEDAIALANSLTQHRDDVPAALVDYEARRQPVVARFQRAADDSAEYFRRVGHHTGMAPLQFVFNLLTRSGRIGHAELTVRDPAFTTEVDNWFGAGRLAPPPAFAPFRLGDLSLPNRIARTGAPNGAGLVYGEFTAVCADGRISPATPVISQAALPSEAGAKFALRLGHAGARGSTRPPAEGVDIALADGWPLVAASARRYGPGMAVPAELDAAGLDRVRDAFARAASVAADAGVDLLELDLAHGYLLAGFLSPLTNHRTDEFGGDLPARLRFPLAVVDAVRAVWPAERPLSVCLTVADWHRGGLTVDDGVRIAGTLAEHGVGLVRVSAGQTVAECQPEYRRAFLTAQADRVRSEVGVAVVVGGYLTTVDEANTIIGAGRADLCELV